jgi:NitT/TauT family transport system substrate-binding protein
VTPHAVAAVIRYAAIALVLGAGVGHAAAGEIIRLRYGQSYSALQSIFALPLLVAERNRYFVREGLDFSMVPVPGGGEKPIAALHNGTADIVHVATPFLIRASLAGRDAVAVAAEFNNPIYSLIANPKIGSYADLKGKLIGMAADTGSITLSIRRLLDLHGLHNGDYRTRFVDGTPNRLACLTSGDCDAVPLGQPQDFYAIRHGYRLLGRSTEAMPHYLYTVTAARPAWAAAHKDALVRYVRALAAAFRFIRDPSHRDDVVTTIADTSGFDQGNARLTLDLYLDPDRGVLPRRGEINPEAMKQVIAMMAEAGQLGRPLPAAARFVSLDYLQAAGIR